MNIHYFLSSFAYFSLERGMGITNILVLKLVQFQKESHHLGEGDGQTTGGYEKKVPCG